MLLPDQVFPPDYRLLQARRLQTLQDLYRSLPGMRSLLAHYKHHPEDFITDWIDTFDPRNAGKPGMTVRMPFVLFERQRERGVAAGKHPRAD